MVLRLGYSASLHSKACSRVRLCGDNPLSVYIGELGDIGTTQNPLPPPVIGPRPRGAVPSNPGILFLLFVVAVRSINYPTSPTGEDNLLFRLHLTHPGLNLFQLSFYCLGLPSEEIEFLFLGHGGRKGCSARSRWCPRIKGRGDFLVCPCGSWGIEVVTTSRESPPAYTHIRPGGRTATEAKPHTPSKSASHTSPSTKSIRHFLPPICLLSSYKLFLMFLTSSFLQLRIYIIMPCPHLIQLPRASIGWIAIIGIVSIRGITPIESATLVPEPKTAASESGSPGLSHASSPIATSSPASAWDPRVGKAGH
jgi:hypothetical protein